MQRISIIGLGWLGIPLADTLKNKGYSVKGSTTQKDKQSQLKEKDYEVSLLNFNPHPEGESFNGLFDTDILFVNIPPRSRTMPETFHPEQIKFLRALIDRHDIKKVIYVSATSVYPDLSQTATEEDSLSLSNTGNKALLTAENILKSGKTYDLTIIRYGGLLGVDRIPGKYFSAKENVQGDTPVNYIHRDDAVSLAAWIIEKGLWNETFNAVAPKHPLRREVYEKNAADLGFPPPKSYSQNEASFKVISPEKIITTGFTFTIPDPLDFWYEKPDK
ncbi:epimerase [Arthrospiribacter ruber]|uniref:Epimerase n=1 Tax=Arthrospiribacter ruber TaxID=2487934 RepID=A0A951J0M7_9BACT|nr:epimerase [Arthrospiribacter ruber]MBW3469013.1 epimerase [Arthrospiribacter ruber]